MRSHSKLRCGWRVAPLSFLLLMLTACASPAQEHEPGIKVGDEAPAFELKDQDGNDVSLAELLKEKPTAIVFHRSASW